MALDTPCGDWLRLLRAFGSCHLVVAYLSAIGWLAPLAAEDKAERAGVEQQFAAHLAAGEFGPARRLAEGAAAQRDVWLNRLAQAQADGGARNASLSTAIDIQDDQLRTNAFTELARNRFPTTGARGGAALADFDTLIALIQSTVSPDSWLDNGGEGAIDSFPTGVLVDAAGLLSRRPPATESSSLATLRHVSRERPGGDAPRDARRESPLRKISLTRLERWCQRLAAEGRLATEEMRVLAGLRRIQYVFLYPESRDIVLAGPAGDWTRDPEGRIVHVESGQPTLQLDDLVVVLRNSQTHGGRFTCAITPRAENLAAVQQFTAESTARPLRAGGRTEWLRELRERLGHQDISVQGIDPRTRTARVLVEADYRMKLVGMGLEPGVLGVISYLDAVAATRPKEAPPTAVLRWWFALGEQPVRATRERDAFRLPEKSVRVLSENELLSAAGERIHTGESEPLNQQFAHSFSRHFDALASRYPVYAELRNVLELALVAELLRETDAAGQMNWKLPHFGAQGTFEPTLGPAPRQVATVMNHREVNRQLLLVGVSGGVSCDPRSQIKSGGIVTDQYGEMTAERGVSRPGSLARSEWWWD